MLIAPMLREILCRGLLKNLLECISQCCQMGGFFLSAKSAPCRQRSDDHDQEKTQTNSQPARVQVQHSPSTSLVQTMSKRSEKIFHGGTPL